MRYVWAFFVLTFIVILADVSFAGTPAESVIGPHVDGFSASPYARYDGWEYANLTACSIDAAWNLNQDLEECTLLSDNGRIEVEHDGVCVSCLVLCPNASFRDVPENSVYTVLHGNARIYFESEGASTVSSYYGKEADGVVGTAGVPMASFYDTWRNLDDISRHIKDRVLGTNGKVQIEELHPPTHENRSLMAVRVRGQNWRRGGPRVVITFLQHAREWISAMTGAYVVEEVAQRATTDPDFFADIELVLIPVVNPDGFAHTASSDRFWRKNKNKNGGNRCSGVDLNRNWDKAWGTKCTGSTCSNSECDETYIGSAAHSEPEVQAVMEVMNEAPMSVHLDIHACSQIIIAPWGFTTSRFPREQEAMVLGNHIKAAMKAINGNSYNVGSGGDIIYAASGTAQDYSTSKGALGFTIELPPLQSVVSGISGCFAPSASSILPTAKEAVSGIWGAVEWAKSPQDISLLSGSRSMSLGHLIMLGLFVQFADSRR